MKRTPAAPVRGQKARLRPCTCRERIVWGFVMYVNQNHGYFTVRYRLADRWFLESFRTGTPGREVRLYG